MKLNIFFVCSLPICFSPSMNLVLLTAMGTELCYPDYPSRSSHSLLCCMGCSGRSSMASHPLEILSQLASGLAPFQGISLSALRPYGSLRPQPLATIVSVPIPAPSPELSAAISLLCLPSFVQSWLSPQ